MNSKQALNAALETIQRQWGTQALYTANNQRPLVYLSTGFPALDALLGGGLPRGRQVELLGQPTSGMTSLALHTAAAAQQEQEVVVYLDLPATFDPEYAALCHVQVSKLLLVRPQTGGDASDILFDVVTSRVPGLVVLNTLTDLPAQERKKLAVVLERVNPALARSRCVLLLLSYTPLSTYAALRLRIEVEAWIEAEDEVCGYQVQVTALKHPSAAGQQVRLRIQSDGEGTEA